eukprot:gb/GFBE01043464.1/.p1 GENE.gb/GFBE01043464.1/~~gb/GFBE01043464.1/.p1  ORF type:complete len:151 (+),score=21.65 gb/GFBE01043464.1/:1-453(+)
MVGGDGAFNNAKDKCAVSHFRNRVVIRLVPTALSKGLHDFYRAMKIIAIATLMLGALVDVEGAGSPTSSSSSDSSEEPNPLLINVIFIALALIPFCLAAYGCLLRQRRSLHVPVSDLGKQQAAAAPGMEVQEAWSPPESVDPEHIHVAVP